MPILGPRRHWFEINDQPWFPPFLRSCVQSCLTLAWTFRIPYFQPSSPAALVASTLHRVLGGPQNVTKYSYVDFCAGAGGPTPEVERIMNARLRAEGHEPVMFALTDLHPHIEAWTAAAKKGDRLTFCTGSVDAANAPKGLLGDEPDSKVFRLFNLAFHHFDDELAGRILRNSVDTAGGFGFVSPFLSWSGLPLNPMPTSDYNPPPTSFLYSSHPTSCLHLPIYITHLLTAENSIFELQSRSPASLLTITLLGPLLFALTPFYFSHSPLHFLFTYIIPIIPFVVVFDGYVSCMRTRTPEEVLSLLEKNGGLPEGEGWVVRSGSEMHTWPMGYMSWVIAVKGGRE
ncbi:MAG: hypothetical protein M1830_008764 [Pleopsidium flavum]|nr:MAG: hypothetical protein M1830_008764 [Pleopsidium flavum]